MHNARLQPDAFYAEAVALPNTWWQSLDTAQSKALNGDAGGTWNPPANIIINAANLPAWMPGTTNYQSLGVWCAGPWQSVGGFATNVGKPIVHGDSDFIQLGNGHAGATRVIHTSVSEGLDISDGTAVMGFDFGTSGFGTLAGGTFRTGGRVLVPLRVHSGATFTQAVFTLIVNGVHANVPQSLPQFRVYKVDNSGNVTPLNTTTAMADGYVPFPTPASGAAWTNGGNAQTLTYPIDANVVIDPQASYFAEIADEDGTNAITGNYFLDIACTFTTIPDLRWA